MPRLDNDIGDGGRNDDDDDDKDARPGVAPASSASAPPPVPASAPPSTTAEKKKKNGSHHRARGGGGSGGPIGGAGAAVGGPPTDDDDDDDDRAADNDHRDPGERDDDGDGMRQRQQQQGDEGGGGAMDEDSGDGEGEGDGGGDRSSDDDILFSCRCESAKSVATLLSCLRSVSSSSSSTGGGGSTAASASAHAEMSVNVPHSTADDRRGGMTAGAGGGRAQHATVFAGPEALTFHVKGLGGQSQASVDMQAGLFSDYYVGEQVVPILEESNDDEEDHTPTSQRHSQKQPKTETIRGGEFGINLTTVLECLHVLGTASLDRTKLCLSYDVRDAILKMELLEDGMMGGSAGGGADSAGGGVLSTCAIPGLAVPDDDEAEDGGGSSSLAVAFRSSPIVARAILKSDFLRDAVLELGEVPGATAATVAVGPDGVEFATVGHSSECHVSLPRASASASGENANAEVYVSLECDPPRLHARSYPLRSVLSAMRGLEIGTETCVSLNARGMIAIQHQVLDSVGNGRPNFVDFIMGCLQDEDEDEDEQEEGDGAGRDEPEVDLDDASMTAISQGSARLSSREARRKGLPQSSAVATVSSSAVLRDDDRSVGDTDDDNGDGDENASAGDEAVVDVEVKDDGGPPLFGTVGDHVEPTSRGPERRKKNRTYRRNAKERRAGRQRERSRSRSRSRSPSPVPPPQDQSEEISLPVVASGFDDTEEDEDDREKMTGRKRPSPAENGKEHNKKLMRRRSRKKRAARPPESDDGGIGGDENDGDDDENGVRVKSSSGDGAESRDHEGEEDVVDGSPDVNAATKPSSRTTPMRKAKASSGERSEAEEEPPSSPELMYGDTRLEGPSQLSPEDEDYAMISSRSRPRSRSNRLRSSAASRRSRYDDSDETDNDEGF